MNTAIQTTIKTYFGVEGFTVADNLFRTYNDKFKEEEKKVIASLQAASDPAREPLPWENCPTEKKQYEIDLELITERKLNALVAKCIASVLSKLIPRTSDDLRKTFPELFPPNADGPEGEFIIQFADSTKKCNPCGEGCHTCLTIVLFSSHGSEFKPFCWRYYAEGQWYAFKVYLMYKFMLEGCECSGT